MDLLPGADSDGRVAEAERLLRHYLRRERLDAAVQRPAPALGGRTLTELATEDPDELLRGVRAMFDLHRAVP